MCSKKPLLKIFLVLVAGEKGVCLEDGYITQPGSRQGRWVFIRTVEVLCIRIKFVAQLSPSGVATRDAVNPAKLYYNYYLGVRVSIAE